MASERYVRPPLLAREAPPEWLRVWRFRVVALVVLAALVGLTYLVFQRTVTGVGRQDPGVGALSPLPRR